MLIKKSRRLVIKVVIYLIINRYLSVDAIGETMYKPKFTKPYTESYEALFTILQ